MIEQDKKAAEYATQIAGGPLHDQSWNYVKRDFLVGVAWERERTKEVVAALDLLLDDVAGYPAYERPCFALEQATAALARYREALAPRREKTKCPPHEWSRDGETCTKCGDKDWM